jgi:UDP-2,4-diacetamido-2,4,6-trideoxy-beta-L-altropyranose hydrolase
MPPGTLIVRADASVAMGTGHVMRCLALAQAWQDEGGSCIFAMAQATPAVEERVRAEGFGVSVVPAHPASQQDAAAVIELADSQHPDWVVVDGYHFDLEYQRTLKAAGLKVLVIDDGGQCKGYCADFVLDQGLDASEDPYKKREAHTRLMLGTRYVMLRREFTRSRKWERESPEFAGKLLITIGGSDPDRLTFRLIEALPQIASPGLETTVVVGGSNPCITALQGLVQCSPLPVELLLDPASMPEVMARSDLAVICAGGTVWELLYMGCPVLSYARDAVQGDIIARLHALGALHNLGLVDKFKGPQFAAAIGDLALSRLRREEMGRIGRTVVDGEGPRRVLRQLLGGNSQ